MQDATARGQWENIGRLQRPDGCPRQVLTGQRHESDRWAIALIQSPKRRRCRVAADVRKGVAADFSSTLKRVARNHLADGEKAGDSPYRMRTMMSSV